MSTAIGTYCPAWCTANHSLRDFDEDDLVVHSKNFGSFNDGEVALVQVWKIKCRQIIESIGVTVPVEDMKSPEDLRLLAYNCLEAADWMEEKLGHLLVSHEVTV